MIVKSKKFSAKQLSIIITASVLAFLIVAYAVMSIIMSNSSIGEGNTDKKPPEILEGESIKANTPIAYPAFAASAVQSLYVNSDKGFFGLKLPSEDEKGLFNSQEDFVFYYEDEYGKIRAYAPPICLAEANFNYTDLYAVEKDDGYNLYKLSYLLSAVGTLYFSERIMLSADSSERTVQLNRYGFGENVEKKDYESFSVTYLAEDGKSVQYVIHIGNQLVTGLGYYYRVGETQADGSVKMRDCIYTSINNNFDYALDGFTSFVGSRLVAAGLISDGVYEPYLTTDYKQWKSTLHYEKNYSAENPFVINKNHEVVFLGSSYSSSDFDSRDNTKTHISVKLSSLDGYFGDYSRISSAFIGKGLGKDNFKGLSITAVTNANEAKLYNSADNTGKYTYTVSEILAVLTADGETTDPAAKIVEDSLIKVKYTCQIDGKSQNTDDKGNEFFSYGVIDLGADTPISEAALMAFSGKGVGTLSSPVTLEAKYTADNTDKVSYSKEITEIAVIYKDKTGAEKLSAVAEDSVVTYRYRIVLIDGAGNEHVTEQGSETVDLSAMTSEGDLKIKKELLTRPVGVLGKNDYITILSDMTYLQSIAGFTTYEIDELSYVVADELKVAFEFLNASDRHPFFGESLYKNNLTGKYGSYALNSTSCENVVRILGGISNSSSSQQSEGLVGAETVAVGLTPHNMNYYGLYANKIHFELPRGIDTVDLGGNSDDYVYLDKLEFNLYISEVQPDGTRYIGSDMYDVIVKIDAENFIFLDLSFTEYWARRNVVLVNYSEIDRIVMDFNMTDRLGSYDFDLAHKTVWISGNTLSTEEVEGATPYDRVVVTATQLSESTNISSKFTSLLADRGVTSLPLNVVYDNKFYEQDELATSNFKDVLQLMYSTYYAGSLTEAEQASALESAPMLMKMTLTLEGEYASRPYVYEFYRVDDRRVMVSIYNVNLSGDEVSGTRVSDFYISTFAFKKIARSWFTLLDGGAINVDEGYEPESAK